VIRVLNSVISVVANDTQCPSASRLKVRDEDGVIFATCYATNGGVVKIDDASGSVVSLVSDVICPGATALVVRADGSIVAACSDDGSGAGGVILIAANGTVTQIMTNAQCPLASGVTIRPRTGAILAACFDDTGGIVEYDVVSGALRQVATGAQCPGAMDVAVRESEYVCTLALPLTSASVCDMFVRAATRSSLSA
jgi:hypothetical protein